MSLILLGFFGFLLSLVPASSRPSSSQASGFTIPDVCLDECVSSVHRRMKKEPFEKGKHRQRYHNTRSAVWDEIEELLSALPGLTKEKSLNFVAEVDGVRVWRARNPVIGQMSPPGAEAWPLTVSKCDLNSPPTTVAEYLFDSSKVQQYNKFSQGRHDVAQFGPDTKVCHNVVSPPLCKRPHDFVTVIHRRKWPDGTVVVASRCCEHPSAPQDSKFVRSEILCGVNILRPLGGSGERCECTSISQVRYAGIAPIFVSRNFLRPAVNFLVHLRGALGGVPGGDMRDAHNENRKKRQMPKWTRRLL